VKALAKAVRDVFGDRVQIQRCQLHKTRNVLEHLPESMQAVVRSCLRKAYQEADAANALKAL
jgi:transposase-like protein